MVAETLGVTATSYHIISYMQSLMAGYKVLDIRPFEVDGLYLD